MARFFKQRREGGNRRTNMRLGSMYCMTYETMKLKSWKIIFQVPRILVVVKEMGILFIKILLLKRNLFLNILNLLKERKKNGSCPS
ncbi:hypothetical protein Gotri_001376 [Gossypium trilobum]|uniref:Uncharacterized protein n=1 Tax=Gossypium trilobum TaxID=34281 RepID=A0A7J9FEI4_9ROSI|nr:hypothetical protein [Gossypium trilobum]